MRLLVGADLLDVVVDGAVEAGSGKGSLVKLGKTVAVEGVLEVLQGQGIVEDVGYGTESV